MRPRVFQYLGIPDRVIVIGNLADLPRKILGGIRLHTLVQALAEV